jgi:chromate reductase, NAD(P)H dehydrogenase (quinone)
MSVKVVGIPGSLREGSFNRGLLRAAIELAPTGMEIQMFTRLGDIPQYNATLTIRAIRNLYRRLRRRFARRMRC